jgi:hypothetical protein
MVATMTYGEQIRHPGAALDPQQDKKGGGVNWRLIVGLTIVALVLVAIIRPQWLSRLGIQFAGGAGKALGGIANPHGWV